MRIEKLNRIPVRTVRKQHVNYTSVEIEDIEIKKFDNVSISGINENEGISLERLEKGNKHLVPLKYGINENLMKETDEEFTNGYLIKVKENAKITENVILNFDLNKENSALIDNIIVVAEKNSKASITIKYESDMDAKYHNGVLRVFAAEKADIKVAKVNLLEKNVDNFDSNVSVVAKDANVEFVAIELGARNRISNYEAILESDNSKAEASAIYSGIEDEKIDMNYIMTIKGKKSDANIDIKGALKDKSVKTFKGTLDFIRGAKHSKGSEEEYCMLLSDKAKSRAIPLLLCEEEDVSGEHAASSGRIDENKLFYLMSRGISYEEARILIINAAFNPIIDKIDSEELRNKILVKVKEILA